MTFKSSALFAFRLMFPRSAKKSSARRSIFGAVLCIGISLVPLVLVMSFSDGMINGMTQRIIGLSTGELKSVVRSSAKAASSFESLSEYGKILSQIDGIQDVFLQVECEGLASGKKSRIGVAVRAVENDIFERNADFASLLKVKAGSIEQFKSAKKTAVIGEKVSELLELAPGDKIRLILTKTLPNGAVSPVTQVFTVSAVVSSGYQELDSMWVFIPIEQSFSVLPKASSLYSVMIRTVNGVNADLAKIRENCEANSYGIARVYAWFHLNRNQLQNFSSTKVMLTFIMLLIVLVASVNISSALVMLVMERRKEIAILKSIGGSASGITVSFLIAGVSCGFAGTLIGLPVGILCAVNSNQIVSAVEHCVNFFSKILFILSGHSLASFENIQLLNPAYYLTEIPISIPYGELFMIASSVLLLSLVVSVVPAIKAGRESPLETFRKA